ncbi:MAG: hypothetical protein QG671_1826 [Actinomycetota bacterium]|nr:hypothetical protein [Actinomycetota bacterium]
MSTDQSHPGAAQRRIAEAFDAYFDRFNIRITAEDVVVGIRRTIRQDGWAITYRVDPDTAGLPTLEFYATHRMTNDRHVVISADGSFDHLDAIKEYLIIAGPDSAAEFHAHNDNIEDRLRSRGLYPHGQSGQAGAGGH